MTIEHLWQRYARIWSLPATERSDELSACLADDVTYCDPNGLIEGRDALSDYMGGFQEAFPGRTFRISAVANHHDRSLANWSLIGPDDRVQQNGKSFSLLSPDGRLLAISGFFDSGSQNLPTQDLATQDLATQDLATTQNLANIGVVKS